MKKLFINTWSILKKAGKAFVDDKAMKLSASLAYYTVFSITPLLIVIISICGIFLGEEAVQGQIYSQIDGLVGSEAALQIQSMIRKASLFDDNIWATVLGLITLFMGATAIFAEIQNSINMIWGVKAKPRNGGLKRFIINRLLSFSMIISMGFLLLVSLIINAMLQYLSEQIGQVFPDIGWIVLQALNFCISLLIITLLFAAIFKVLPDVSIKWKDVFTGGLITAFLFVLGKSLIGYYLGHSNLISEYGAAGSIIIILMWVYYSSGILFFGAEITQSYTQMFGSGIKPEKYAVFIEQREVKPSKTHLRLYFPFFLSYLYLALSYNP